MGATLSAEESVRLHLRPILKWVLKVNLNKGLDNTIFIKGRWLLEI